MLLHGTRLVSWEPCEFLRPHGHFETHSELTGLTARGTFDPPRCRILTLRPGYSVEEISLHDDVVKHY